MLASVLLHSAALQNPAEMMTLNTINICAGNVNVYQDPRFSTLLPAQAQTLPLDYCASWPAWVIKEGGKVPVSRIQSPDPTDNPLEGWVPPLAFEQLWLPEDLPTPKSRAAVGLVLRNGDPRYVFPTVDTFLETSDGTVWRNRGLNSVPIASTWLHFGELPPESLRFSAYHAAPEDPSPSEPEASEQTTADGSDGAEGAASAEGKGLRVGKYTRVVPNTQVHQAIDAGFDALDALPPLLRKSSLGDGFSFLICPLVPDSADGNGSESIDNSGLFLPPSALAPGGRLRAFLAEEGSDEDRDAWQRGELDLTMFALPPGRESPYMQSQYAPLFNHDW